MPVDKMRRPVPTLSRRMYLLISFRKSTPPPNRQLIVYYHRLRYQVDGFWGGFDILKQIHEYIVSDNIATAESNRQTTPKLTFSFCSTDPATLNQIQQLLINPDNFESKEDGKLPRDDHNGGVDFGDDS